MTPHEEWIANEQLLGWLVDEAEAARVDLETARHAQLITQAAYVAARQRELDLQLGHDW